MVPESYLTYRAYNIPKQCLYQNYSLSVRNSSSSAFPSMELKLTEAVVIKSYM